VTDAEGKPVTQVKAQATGAAEFSEFMKDFGLSGRRAATQVSEQLRQAVLANPQLR